MATNLNPHISKQKFTCEICGRVIRGPAYYRHRKHCSSQQTRRQLQLYPIKLPVITYRAFQALCKQRGQSLKQGVTELIERELEKNADSLMGKYPDKE